MPGAPDEARAPAHVADTLSSNAPRSGTALGGGRTGPPPRAKTPHAGTADAARPPHNQRGPTAATHTATAAGGSRTGARLPTADRGRSPGRESRDQRRSSKKNRETVYSSATLKQTWQRDTNVPLPQCAFECLMLNDSACRIE